MKFVDYEEKWNTALIDRNIQIISYMNIILTLANYQINIIDSKRGLLQICIKHGAD